MFDGLVRHAADAGVLTQPGDIITEIHARTQYTHTDTRSSSSSTHPTQTPCPHLLPNMWHVHSTVPSPPSTTTKSSCCATHSGIKSLTISVLQFPCCWSIVTSGCQVLTRPEPCGPTTDAGPGPAGADAAAATPLLLPLYLLCPGQLLAAVRLPPAAPALPAGPPAAAELASEEAAPVLTSMPARQLPLLLPRSCGAGRTRPVSSSPW